MTAHDPTRTVRPDSIVLAGGGGALGSAVLEQLLALGGYAQVGVLVTQPLKATMRRLVPIAWPGVDDAAAVQRRQRGDRVRSRTHGEQPRGRHARARTGRAAVARGDAAGARRAAPARRAAARRGRDARRIARGPQHARRACGGVARLRALRHHASGRRDARTARARVPAARGALDAAAIAPDGAGHAAAGAQRQGRRVRGGARPVDAALTRQPRASCRPSWCGSRRRTSITTRSHAVGLPTSRCPR